MVLALALTTTKHLDIIDGNTNGVSSNDDVIDIDDLVMFGNGYYDGVFCIF